MQQDLAGKQQIQMGQKESAHGPCWKISISRHHNFLNFFFLRAPLYTLPGLDLRSNVQHLTFL